MSNNKNIDNLFKKALDEQGYDPPEYIWKNIEANLYKRKKIYSTWWFRSLSTAAFIALFIGLAQLIRLESDTDIMFNIIEVAEIGISDVSDSSIISNMESTEQISQKTSETIIEKKQIPQKNTTSKKLTIRKELSVITIPENQMIVAIPNSTMIASLKISNVRTFFIPITSKEALKNNRQYSTLRNTDVSKEKEKKKIKMVLSGHLSPTYSSGNYSSSVTNTLGDSYSSEELDGLMNMGGGLKLAVHANKRLSFQTGLSYSRMGQKNTESSVARHATTFAVTGGNRVSTFLGDIKHHEGVDVYANVAPILLNSVAAKTDVSLEQVFNTLSIPLHVSYRLNDSRVLFSILGGFSGDFIVGNKVYLETGAERELIGSTQNIRTFNISTDLGLGVRYPISNKIKIMVEPGFKYYLQSISRDKRIDFKPYAFTFSTGIGFEF